ncbi:tetratricopeptide repeat protein [Kitasatospora sp. NPDC008115]|uniref:tetratricopeptide repeat protein n=1 Tax=Kitasatospora sp. NPDC008115 TaxID=3364022 RepID=UPI0036EE1E1E
MKRKGRGTRGFGSGYLIAPRLVLTAEHVLEGADVATVRLPDTSEREFSATVRWRRNDGAVDAALIEVDDHADWQVPESLADSSARPTQRFGRLIGTRAHPVDLTGFPRLQKEQPGGSPQKDFGRLDEHLSGHITPGTGMLAGRYEITSTTPVPAGPPTDSGTRWSGISGAAVLADDGYGQDLLCGVVRRDRNADGGTRLTATPVSTLLADHDFRTLLADHTRWEPVLEPIEPAVLLAAASVDRAFRSPAALLRADAEAVAFHGRDAEVADLRAWCEGGTRALAIRVMTGPGGQGKTRLARHLTGTLGRHGWVAGHLRSDLTDDPAIDGRPPDFTTLNTALPLLLVVDYAETRPVLVRRLITHLHRSRHRVRLLLLARADGGWRTGSFQAVPEVRDLLADAPVHPLRALIAADAPDADRRAEFRQAVGDLAHLMPRLPAYPPCDWQALVGTLHPPADLGHPRYRNALTLQMTALVALLQHGPGPADTAPGAPPERTLLRHEERFWEHSARAPAYGLHLAAPALAAAVATAALCGAGTREEAVRVVATLSQVPDHQQDSTAAWLASLYPGQKDRYWGTLQPDRVAEYHASRTLRDHRVALPTLLAVGTAGQQAQAVTVLARAAIAHYNADRVEESASVLRMLDSALHTTPLSRLALRTATAALPHPSRITAPLALELTDALVRADRALAARDPGSHEADLASSLASLSVDLADVGRRAEALAAAEEALALRRRLAAEDPALHEPDLATSLANLGVRRWELGLHAEALVAAEEAVGLRRGLAYEDPAAHEPGLATSLAYLGNHLTEVGRHAEALTATEEAVGIRRRIAPENPAAYEPDLARSLSDLGNHLSVIGRHAEALAAEEEAVGIRRRLAADNPAAYEPELALSLSNLGVDLSEVGRHAEALAATEEAVEIRRRLAADNPTAYEPDLARSLVNLSVDLFEVGRHAEALAASEEAVEIRRRLAADNPTAYEPGFARSLANIATPLSEVGRHAEALAAAEEAVEIRRRLAADNPAAYEPDLAQSLANVATTLSEVGRHAEALAAAEEAVEIQRRLTAEDCAVHEPDLAVSLADLGHHLSAVGRRPEALAALKDAAGIRRRLAADNPGAHEIKLAQVLAASAELLETLGDLSGALREAEEAVERFRRYAAAAPALPAQLRSVLGLQARLLDALGRPQEATAVRHGLEAQA